MTVKIIEAEYQITSTQFWEIKYIEGWPTDHEGQPRDLDTANDHYVKWDCCSCSGRVATTSRSTSRLLNRTVRTTTTSGRTKCTSMGS